MKDKIVLVLRYFPEDADQKTRGILARYADLRYKAMAARQRGAKAMLVVTGPRSPNAGELAPMTFDTALAGSGIVAASVTGDVARQIMRGVPGKTLEQLIARADAARPDQQPDLYVEIAERQMKSLLDASHDERWAEFRVTLQDVIKYCDRAQVTAIQSKKKVKRTEIKIRQISVRLRNMKFDVDADDQPSVQAAVDKLEHFRAELFKSMFSMGDKDQ